MNKFFKSSVVATAVAASGLFLGATEASAETATAQFSGTVASACTFAAPSGIGALVVDGNTLTSTGGTPVNIDITCNDAATIAVGAPTVTSTASGANLTFQSLTSALAVNGGATINNGDPATAVGTANTVTTTTLTVNMVADYGSQLPADTYNFDVVLTSTP